MENYNIKIRNALDYVPRNRVIYARCKAPFAWAFNLICSLLADGLKALVFSAALAAVGSGVLTAISALGGVGSDSLIKIFMAYLSVGSAIVFGFLVVAKVFTMIFDGWR